MSAAWPVMTVGDRLHRVESLAALLENVVGVMAPRESNYDFSLDEQMYAGLAAVANVIREDLEAAEAVLEADVLDRKAPRLAYTGRGMNAGEQGDAR